MEHHSNDLPWRRKATIKYIDTTPDGEINLDHLVQLINSYQGRIKLVSITGASNVTGYINPIYEIARLSHEAGAKILVDASQLVPHRLIDIRENDDMEHIDFIAYTSHKLYAPFGVGVLVGPRDFFNDTEPHYVGGGTIKMVTENEVYWDETPERNEAGTPNVMGAVALAASIKQIQTIGYNMIEEHEKALMKYLLDGLKRIDEVKIYGCMETDMAKRLGVVSFNMDKVPHSLVSAILSFEYGLGVRNGCFCAHPYIQKLMNVSPEKIHKVVEHPSDPKPGMVRASFGIYNEHQEVEKLLNVLQEITKDKKRNSKM